MRDRLGQPGGKPLPAGRAPVSTPRIVWLVGAVLTLFFFVLVVYPPDLVTTLEYVAYDEMVRFLTGPVRPPEVAVVDVDEASLAELGQWPWPRYRIAALIDQAGALGARSIAVDFLFPEPDRLSLNQVSELYRRDRGVALDLGGMPGEALDNDRILAETVARRNVVLGTDLVFEQARADAGGACGNPLDVVLRALPGTEGTPPIPEASGVVCPLPELAHAAAFVGAVNTLPDQDGKVRRVPLVLRCGGQWTPSLAVGALLAASGEKQVVVQWSAAGVLEVCVGGTTIPTDYQGNLLLPFRARPPERFQHISAADLLAGRVAPERIRGKLVFIGSSASGLQDMHATPVMRSCPGLDLHALAADAILRGDFFVEPGWSRSVQALIVILAGLLTSALFAWMPVAVSAAVTALAVAALTLGSWAIFNRWGFYWAPVHGISLLLAGATVLTQVRLRREEKRVLEQVRRLSIAQNCALLGLVSIAETRDPETGRHIIRTQHFVKLLARHLSTHPKFHGELTDENIETIYKSAPLHDVGKVGVPDRILLKPGRLTDEEYDVLKRHTVVGHEVLERSEEMAGVSVEMSFLQYAKQVARSHHEKWDGTGYPDGLKGETIPVSARLMALADVYDALRAKRVYKPEMPHEKAREIICDGSGTHFDPSVVDAFLATEQAFQDVLAEYADAEEVPGHN